MSVIEKFKGKTTVAGNSKALRIDAAFFRAHPEFDTGADIKVQLLGPGQALVSVAKAAKLRQVAGPEEPDPVEQAFLAWLERDMSAHPEHIEPASAELFAKAKRLTRGVKVGD